MSNYWNEPEICKGCTKPKCTGSPDECKLSSREAEGDRKCHMKREGEN
jgi:hypothetical protein